MFFDRELIAQTKQDYPPGTRLELINMDDPHAPVPSGTKGTVDHVDDAGQLHMRWDNGRSLALVPGVDSFRKLTPQELATEAPAELVYLYKNTQNQSATKLSIDNMKLKTYLQKRGYENGGIAKLHLAFADGTGDLSERLGLLSALHIEQPEVEDSFDPNDAKMPFDQTM